MTVPYSDYRAKDWFWQIKREVKDALKCKWGDPALVEIAQAIRATTVLAEKQAREEIQHKERSQGRHLILIEKDMSVRWDAWFYGDFQAFARQRGNVYIYVDENGANKPALLCRDEAEAQEVQAAFDALPPDRSGNHIVSCRCRFGNGEWLVYPWRNEKE